MIDFIWHLWTEALKILWRRDTNKDFEEKTYGFILYMAFKFRFIHIFLPAHSQPLAEGALSFCWAGSTSCPQSPCVVCPQMEEMGSWEGGGRFLLPLPSDWCDIAPSVPSLSLWVCSFTCHCHWQWPWPGRAGCKGCICSLQLTQLNLAFVLYQLDWSEIRSFISKELRIMECCFFKNSLFKYLILLIWWLLYVAFWILMPKNQNAAILGHGSFQIIFTLCFLIYIVCALHSICTVYYRPIHSFENYSCIFRFLFHLQVYSEIVIHTFLHIDIANNFKWYRNEAFTLSCCSFPNAGRQEA